MFKGERKIFAYAILKDNCCFGGHDYKIGRIHIERFFKNYNQADFKILNKELYDKAKFKGVVEKI